MRLKLGVAEEELVDENEHYIQCGRLYLTCSYLEKDEAKSTMKYIQYKKIYGVIYIYPEEVFYPGVNITKDLRLNMNDYSFISDCI